jgi:hypothetical protein
MMSRTLVGRRQLRKPAAFCRLEWVQSLPPNFWYMYTNLHGVISQDRVRSVRLTTHLGLLSRLRLRAAIPPLPLYACLANTVTNCNSWCSQGMKK